MKIFPVLLFSILLVIGFNHSFAQNNEPKKDIPGNIITALKSGNMVELSKHFNANLELVILEEEDVYSKNQAQQILKDFFTKNKPADFKVLHEGGKEDARYVIGTLVTSGGSYRVYFLLKKNESKTLIHTLRIENEDE